MLNLSENKNMNYTTVYRLDNNLSLIEDKIFLHKPEAEHYVILMNRRFCGDVLGIKDCNDIDIIVDRCINHRWRDKQRYFIGKPDMNRSHKQ